MFFFSLGALLYSYLDLRNWDLDMQAAWIVVILLLGRGFWFIVAGVGGRFGEDDGCLDFYFFLPLAKPRAVHVGQQIV